MRTSTRVLTVLASAALLAASTGCSAAHHVAAAAPIARQVKHAVSGLSHRLPAAPVLQGVQGPATTAGAPAGQVKQVHSPGTVAVDEQLTAGQCHIRTLDAAAGLYLPDPLCTPGAVDPAVSQANIASTICRSGYTATVRPPASATAPLKRASLAQYGESPSSTTEFDHVVSLELGGTNSVSNLFPEINRTGATGTTNPKDAVENTLHKAVCNHAVQLTAAQNAIATNWTTALKDLGL